MEWFLEVSRPSLALARQTFQQSVEEQILGNLLVKMWQTFLRSAVAALTGRAIYGAMNVGKSFRVTAAVGLCVYVLIVLRAVLWRFWPSLALARQTRQRR